MNDTEDSVHLETPPTARCFWVVLLVLAAPAASATVSADDAVKRALERSPQEHIAAAAAAELEADADQASLWPQPSVGYEREHVSGDGEETEEAFVLTAPFDLSGRRALAARALRTRARAARLVGDAWRAELEGDVRERYARLAYMQARHEVLAAWVVHLDEVVRLVDRRLAGRESSKYAKMGVERELRAARAQLAQAAVERDTGWLALQTLTGALEAGDWPRVDPLAVQLRDVDEGRVAGRPDVRALDDEIAAAALDARAAGRGWVPVLELEGGYKAIGGEGQRREGYVVGLQVEIPIFDRGQAQRAHARASETRAGAERDFLLQRVAGEVMAAKARVEALVPLARRHRAETDAAAEARLQTVRAAWLGGEVGPLELLDAHRGVVEDAERVLELEADAVQAGLALERWLSGGAR